MSERKLHPYEAPLEPPRMNWSDADWKKWNAEFAALQTRKKTPADDLPEGELFPEGDEAVCAILVPRKR